MVAITLRAGLTRNLTAAEADQNMINLDAAIFALENDRPQPNSIASITRDAGGATETYQMTDGTVIGPLPLTVLSFRVRGAWLPFTLYEFPDVVEVEGVGAFVVMVSHTSGAEFDPALLVEGDAAYRKFAGEPASAASAIYDLVISYQGRLSDMTLPIVIPMLHPIKIPEVGAHVAHLTEPPSTADQVLQLFHNATQIGTVTWLIGEEVGTIVFTADETFAAGDFFSVGLPAAADATAAGMSLGVAAQRVLP